MKLGVCCVYFYGAASEWLLELHLRYIRETLQGHDYKIYAAANRLLPELLWRLRLEPRVEVVDLPWSDLEGADEHGFYLDGLLQRAAGDGCTHLAMFDCDSFPILPDWPSVLLERMHGRRIAAVLRTEAGDTNLPHPCGMFMETAFFTDQRPTLRPPAKDIRPFLDATRHRYDTGIGYGYILWKSGEPWLQLLRSNAVDDHYLMAGIYGDVFFHVGASSRNPIFYLDYQTFPMRLAMKVNRLPVLWRTRGLVERHFFRSNRRVHERIVAELRTDPRGYIGRLGGLWDGPVTQSGTRAHQEGLIAAGPSSR